LGTKLFGYINLTREVLPMMQEKSGVIANIIGMAGAAPRSAYTCGSAANAALIAFAQALGASSQAPMAFVSFGIDPYSDPRVNAWRVCSEPKLRKSSTNPERWMELADPDAFWTHG
jgi:NAD(P)-dependent dehydrogenase (short-subunit alcohol dehydrogenase family)